jgi:hypothetical protein
MKVRFIIILLYFLGSILAGILAIKWIIDENRNNITKKREIIRIFILSSIYSYLGVYLIYKARKGIKRKSRI